MSKSTTEVKTKSLDLTAHFLIAMPGMEDETFAKSVVYVCEHSERGALGIMINKPIELTLPKLFAKVDLPLARKDLQDSPVFSGGPMHTERGFVLHEKQVAQAVHSGGAVPGLSDGAVGLTQSVKQAESNQADWLAMQESKVEQEKSLDQQLIAALQEQEERVRRDTFYASSLPMPDGLEMTTSKDVLEALASGSGPRKVLISLGASGWASGQLESEIAENAWLTVKASPEVIFDTPVNERYSKALALLGLQEWMISREVGRA